MRKIVFHLHVGFAGMDDTRLIIFDDNPTNKELYDIASDLALDWADMYGYYPPSDEDDEDDEHVSENIEGSWEEYNEETHGPLEETRL